MRAKAIGSCLLCLLLLGLAVGDVRVAANRVQLETEVEGEKTAEWLVTNDKVPPPAGHVEGACGLAISPSPAADIYVSDYYHRRVYVFGLSGLYQSQIVLPGVNPVAGINSLDGVCGLAFDSAGSLYANEWHQSVLRLAPSAQVFDSGESTGVAVDGAGNVYVNDRTYVAVYEPSGATLLKEGLPLRIGLGSLGDAYGLAVFNGKVYVPDAADDTVKVYQPAVDPIDPIATISGPGPQHFVSLVDAAVAIDPTNEHLLVVDNRKPGYEHPEAAILEFDSSGAFLGRLPGEPIHGEPTGLAVDPASGRLFVTTGNDAESNVVAYGPYTASGSLTTPPSGGAPTSVPAGPASGAVGQAVDPRTARGPAALASEVIQRGPVRVSFDGELTPRSLPRHGTAPVGFAVDARIVATSGDTPPQLRRIAIEVNRNGHFTPRGLPACRLHEIQPSTTAGALSACRDSLVGEGHFSANVQLPEQSPFPSAGKVLAFNGSLRGRPAIFAHIYGTQPAPTSTVLPFLIRDSQGTFGTALEASLPQATGDWGYVTGLRMTLHRRFSYRGRGRSYLTAGCPAPAGFPGAVFPLARSSFAFAGGMTVVSVLSRSCKAEG